MPLPQGFATRDQKAYDIDTFGYELYRLNPSTTGFGPKALSPLKTRV